MKNRVFADTKLLKFPEYCSEVFPDDDVLKRCLNAISVKKVKEDAACLALWSDYKKIFAHIDRRHNMVIISRCDAVQKAENRLKCDHCCTLEPIPQTNFSTFSRIRGLCFYFKTKR